MSYAYQQLHLAMQCLARSGTVQERLARALTETLVFLRPKDLPQACRAEFCSILGKFLLGDRTRVGQPLAAAMQTIDDQEAHAMAQTIINLYDTVTRYEPLPESVPSTD